MTDEVNNKDSVPATRADIDELAQVTKTTLDAMASKEDLREVEAHLIEKTDRLERGLSHVLKVVNESNQLLKQLQSMPERVSRLERAAFPRK